MCRSKQRQRMPLVAAAAWFTHGGGTHERSALPPESLLSRAQQRVCCPRQPLQLLHSLLGLACLVPQPRGVPALVGRAPARGGLGAQEPAASVEQLLKLGTHAAWCK